MIILKNDYQCLFFSLDFFKCSQRCLLVNWLLPLEDVSHSESAVNLNLKALKFVNAEKKISEVRQNPSLEFLKVETVSKFNQNAFIINAKVIIFDK